MRKDDRLIFEAFRNKLQENAESADERKERVQRGWDINKKRWAKWKAENPEAAAKHAARKAGKSEDAENEPHGYPQGMTAIQNLVLNELKKRGFTLVKISHADKERDIYPTVFMKKQSGPMHTVAEISGWGKINDEPYEEYLANLEDGSEDAEDSAEDKMRDRENMRDEKRRDAETSAAFHYDPMPGLEKTANQIRDLLQGAANDEARTEHIIKMAQTILGDPTEYDKNEYRKMLDGLIVLLNRFIVVPMN